MGLVRSTAMVVGTILGASIFVQPSLITGAVRSVGGVFVVWTLGGALTLCGALIAAELTSAYPESGGVYVFLRRAFSPAAGFLWAWAMFWSMHSGIIAAIAVVFARYVAYFAPLGATGIRAVAIGAILGLSAVNYRGVALGSGVQTAFTIAKVLAVVAIIAVGFALGGGGGGGGGHAPSGAGAVAGPAVGVMAFAAAVGAGLFAFGGWHMVTYTAGETRDPRRTIPRALVAGTLIVTVAYLALNAVYLYVLPLERVVASERIAADAADTVLGGGGGAVMSALVAGSAFGGLAGIVLTGPRVYFSVARDGRWLRWLGSVHPTLRTPHRAIALQAVWSSVLVATGTYGALVGRVIYTEWIFFAAMAVGLVLLRRRAEYAPAFRVPGGPVVPFVFAVCAALVAASQIVADWRHSMVGLLLVVAGLPVYALGTPRQGSEA
jgi:APA family basic amino acid/polyamine antiporter